MELSTRRLTTPLLVALLAATPSLATADYDAGLSSYKAKAYEVAFDQWKDCANEHVAACEYAIGVLYEEGKPVNPDLYQALHWYQRAGRQSYPDAMMRLGFMYATGPGDIVQNPVLAWAWFARAAARGVRQAAEHRDRVGQLLSDSELAEAQRRSDLLSIEYFQQQ